MLDTNIVSELREFRNPRLRAWVGSLADGVCVSAVTIGELQFGASDVAERRPDLASDLEAWIDALVESSQIVDLDARAGRLLGRLQATPALRHLGPPDAARFGSDLAIAATAITAEVPLATLNLRDFRLIARHFPALTVVDPWAAQ